MEISNGGLPFHLKDNIISIIIFTGRSILSLCTTKHYIILGVICVSILNTISAKITFSAHRGREPAFIQPFSSFVRESFCGEMFSIPLSCNNVHICWTHILHAQHIPILPSGGKEFLILSCEGSLCGTSDACLSAKVYCYEIALRLFNRSEFLGAGHQAKCSCNGCKENFVKVFHNASVFSSIHLTGHRHSCPLRN